MKTRNTIGKILGVGGLVAALGTAGCDRDVKQTIGECELGINSVTVIYHQQQADTDTYTLDFGTNGNIRAAVWNDQIIEGQFKCKDGRVLKFGAGSDEPYFSTGGN